MPHVQLILVDLSRDLLPQWRAGVEELGVVRGELTEGSLELQGAPTLSPRIPEPSVTFGMKSSTRVMVMVPWVWAKKSSRVQSGCSEGTMMNLKGMKRAALGPSKALAALSPPPDPAASTLPRESRREPAGFRDLPPVARCHRGQESWSAAPWPYLTTWKVAEIMSSLWSAMPM